jgi:hypothetical protein
MSNSATKRSHGRHSLGRGSGRWWAGDAELVGDLLDGSPLAAAFVDLYIARASPA